jgi:HEPN domain-containing protein
MQNREDLIKVVREWIEKAENDFINAAHTLELGEKGPLDTVCFHAEQCVEKYLKALLVLSGIEFPKTHDIDELFLLVPAAYRLVIEAVDRGRLTDYATITRYPGVYEPISLTEAKHIVALARRIRRDVRKMLPPESLSRKK